jgi:hypothetical protein
VGKDSVITYKQMLDMTNQVRAATAGRPHTAERERAAPALLAHWEMLPSNTAAAAAAAAAEEAPQLGPLQPYCMSTCSTGGSCTSANMRRQLLFTPASLLACLPAVRQLPEEHRRGQGRRRDHLHAHDPRAARRHGEPSQHALRMPRPCASSAKRPACSLLLHRLSTLHNNQVPRPCIFPQPCRSCRRQRLCMAKPSGPRCADSHPPLSEPLRSWPARASAPSSPWCLPASPPSRWRGALWTPPPRPSSPARPSSAGPRSSSSRPSWTRCALRCAGPRCGRPPCVMHPARAYSMHACMHACMHA